MHNVEIGRRSGGGFVIPFFKRGDALTAYALIVRSMQNGVRVVTVDIEGDGEMTIAVDDISHISVGNAGEVDWAREFGRARAAFDRAFREGYAEAPNPPLPPPERPLGPVEEPASEVRSGTVGDAT